MNDADKAEHAQAVMKQFGFNAASGEWLAALHEAQKAASQIQRSKGIPNRDGTIKFYVAPAEDFTDESRRSMHPQGMGWFRQATKLEEINAHTGSMKLTGCYVVYHAPSNQAQICWTEWTTRNDGDAMAAAHTRMTRRFIQGLLQIAVVDELEPENPPGPSSAAGCTHPQDRHVFQGEPTCGADGSWSQEVVCTLCGAVLGWAPVAAPAAAPAQAQAPAQAPAPAQAQAPAQAPQAATAPQQPPAPAPHVPQQPLPPVAQEPVVQAAQRLLQAAAITPQQMRKEQTAPPAAAPTPAVPGEPTTGEGWRDELVKQGMDAATATQIAMSEHNQPIEPALVEDLRNWAWSHYKGDVAKITAVWHDLGFEPVANLPVDQRPRPRGIQALRFLVKMKFNPAPSAV